MFAISMAISFGIKSPFDASVFSASAAALLLTLEGRSGYLSPERVENAVLASDDDAFRG